MRRMRSRNMEGLLASRLGDQDAPRKLQDRGGHGTLMSNNKVRYNTTGTEGRNFLKAVDRYHNRGDWDKNLGGGTSFLQGPTGDSEGYVDPLMRMGDAETIDDYLTDVASERTVMLDRQKLLADPENELDRNEMDAEALDQWHQDQASDKTAQMDAITQVEGPDQMDQMVSQMNPPSTAPSYDPMDDMVAQSGVEGLLSADDAGKKKKKKGLSKSEKAGYAKIGEMLMDSGSAPDMRPPAPPALSIKQGQVAFPGLLASQAPVQQRYTPRGLV